MKKFTALLLVLLILLVGCNNVTNTDGEMQAPTNTPTEAPTDEPTDIIINLPIEDATEGPVFEEDPYVDVDKEEFYADYTPAVSASDAYYRTQHNLMSGDISEQDQKPSISENRPIKDGKYVRNTSMVYSENGDSYYVYASNGKIANIIYKDGAYVTLEEVAAYVYAYGTIPPNYTSGKNTSPKDNPWGIYLRCNHSKFSGNTTRYPYEPMLPDISGCGGELQYYEIDIGTTGTDCDSGYAIEPYNNGIWITRGAARIVYTRYDKNGNGIIETDEVYVFYTYNHYNDFQEYLNYEGGWGEMFGNITGGGKLSSKTDYNPTPYIVTAYSDFSVNTAEISIIIPYVEIDKRQFV